MAQILNGLCSASIAASTTRYVAVQGLTGTPVSTESQAVEIIPTGGTLSLLSIKAMAGSPAGLVTATLYLNGSPTSMTCSTSTTAVGRDGTNSVAVVAGDRVSIEFVAASGVTSRAWGWSVKFVPTTSGECILMGNSNNSAPSNNNHLSINDPSSPTNTETNVRQVIPESGAILKKLYVRLDSDPSSGSITFRVYKNSISANVNVTISAGSTTGSDISNTDTFSAAGDVASLRTTISGGATSSAVHWGIVYVSPNGAGYFIMTGSTGSGSMSNAGTRYLPADGFRGVTTTESILQVVMADAFTAKSMYHRLGTAPGASAGWDLFLRKNAGNTALQTTITGASAVTGSVTTDVAIAQDDTLTVSQVVNSGTPAQGVWKHSIVGYLADPAPAGDPGNGFFRFF